MKKIQILLILILGVLNNTIAQEKEQLDRMLQDTTQLDKIERENYELKYPADWDLDTSKLMGTEFILFSKVNGVDDQFRENVNLIIQDLRGYNVTLDKYVQISESQISTMVTNSEIYVNERQQGEKSEYHKVIYSGKQGIYNLKFEQYYFVIDEKAYVLTLTCENDQFDEYKSTGETILNSFIVK